VISIGIKMSANTVVQTTYTKEDNLADSESNTLVPNVSEVVPEEKNTISLQEAIVQLEKLYTEKEEEVKIAQDAAMQSGLALSQKEREAFQLLRQLTPLQNRFLLNALESTRKELDFIKSVKPDTTA
jgi:hypothetical protein